MSHPYLRGKEPGPIKTSMADILAKCPSEQSRLSMMQAAVFLWAREMSDQVGPEQAASFLQIITNEIAKEKPR